MRGKRSKQYRKLMQQYGLTFGFREPYQVLVDAQMIQDSERFKMDLVRGLERTLHGKVKLMITQCSIRHLYTLPSVPQSQKDSLINIAKTMERRRCNHHTLEKPLTTLECLSSVIDPKGSHTNHNRYVVASQEEEVRRHCRGIKGVPLVFVKRSVMIMEPMADSSMNVREGIEKGKFRTGLRGRSLGVGAKRKRDEESSDAENKSVKSAAEAGDFEGEIVKRKKARGPKGPNPLSVKKAHKGKENQIQGIRDESTSAGPRHGESDKPSANDVEIIEVPSDQTLPPLLKRKRKRKPKAEIIEDEASGQNIVQEPSD